MFFVANLVLYLGLGYVSSTRIVHDLETNMIFLFDDGDCYLMFIVNGVELFVDSKEKSL